MIDQDVWDSVDNAELAPSTYFGKVNFDIFYCVLRKGEGAILFDPTVHKPEDRRTQIKIMITPLTTSRAQYLTERRALAESADWVKVTLASIKSLGLSSARELENKWVHYVMEPTGRTYTNKDGIEKSNTMPKFLAVYDSEEAAEAARAARYNKEEDTPSTDTAPTNGERDVALKFLPGLVQIAGKDKAKVAGILASQPLVNKYFTVDSPEVAELLR